MLAYVMLELLEHWRLGQLTHRALQIERALYPKILDLVLLPTPGLRQSALQWVGDARLLREGLHSPALTALMDLPVGLGFVVLVWLIDAWLGVLVLFGLMVLFLVGLVTEFLLHPRLEQSQQFGARGQRVADELLRQGELLQGNAMREPAREHWMRMEQASWTAQRDASRLSGGLQASARLVQLLVSSGLLGIAAALLLWGRFPEGPGMMLVASILGGRALLPLVQLITHWRTVVQCREAFGRLDRSLAQLPAVRPPLVLPTPQGKLTVEPLSLSIMLAPQQPPVPVIVQAGGFQLEPGQVLGIIGPSGAGKSSLARIMAGVWLPSSGFVRLDGADLGRWVGEGDGGRHVGYLPQSVDLFEGTIEQNICRFGPASTELLEQAIEVTGLQAVLDQLPDGLGTVCEAGLMISGGMRQRIGLARAVYGQPRLVVLDEPTAHLDEAGVREFAALLGRLRQGRITTVLVTHRRSLLAQCDLALVLQAGIQRRLDAAQTLLQQLGPAHTAGSA